MGIDRFDKHLLSILTKDASLSNAILGEKIGLSASQVSRRRARLEAEGYIRGYLAEPNYAALDLALSAFIKVRLHGHSKSSFDNFKALIHGLPEVCLACTLTGDADYLLQVRVKDLASLSALISQELLVHDDVREVRSDVVLEMIKDDKSLAAYNL